MKQILKVIVFFGIIALNIACSRPNRTQKRDNPFPVKYENELFSVSMPKGWKYDASGWNGLESRQNEVELYNEDVPVWFHIVKTFMPVQWKSIEEATEMAIAARALCGEEAQLVKRIDSVEVGGYPASILYFANCVDNDTIIQKQFVTYLQDSHIVMYFNEIFHSAYWERAEEYGDKIIETIKLKKVRNPLEQNGKVKSVLQKSLENNEIDDQYMEQAKKVVEQSNKK